MSATEESTASACCCSNASAAQTELAVRDRYSKAAGQREASLCCPIEYDPRYLEAIPAEVIERDYGCGDPSAWLQPGEKVLDLGSGTGKICFIAAQVVGSGGHVTGVDMNPEMLALARSAAPRVAERIGYANVEFLEGRIQDLSFDPRVAVDYLACNSVRTAAEALQLEVFVRAACRRTPLIGSGSMDVVISNCVLNLVPAGDKPALFSEIFRVTTPGGRAVISDIISDHDVPHAMQENRELWSGCIAGALREDHFVEAFRGAGFLSVRVLRREEDPWKVIDGIEFRSLTVEAAKNSSGCCG